MSETTKRRAAQQALSGVDNKKGRWVKVRGFKVEDNIQTSMSRREKSRINSIFQKIEVREERVSKKEAQISKREEQVSKKEAQLSKREEQVSPKKEQVNKKSQMGARENVDEVTIMSSYMDELLANKKKGLKFLSRAGICNADGSFTENFKELEPLCVQEKI